MFVLKLSYMKKILFLVSLVSVLLNNVSQTTHTVNSGSYYYNPSSLTINLGDSVIWINDGGFHDVNGNINSITGQSFNNPVAFDSPPTSTVGAVIFSYKFTVVGTYEYDCSIGSHAANGMVGTVIVQDNSTGFSESFSSILSATHNNISNTINIELINNVINPRLELYNIEGKLIQSLEIETKFGENNYEIPINNPLNKGVYILVISDNEQRNSKKLIVY